MPAATIFSSKIVYMISEHKTPKTDGKKQDAKSYIIYLDNTDMRYFFKTLKVSQKGTVYIHPMGTIANDIYRMALSIATSEDNRKDNGASKKQQAAFIKSEDFE